jgi:hypothetical protein|eukprot:COSAG01_NODE_473_length_16542_cov_42.403651_6_plen_121_part_00
MCHRSRSFTERRVPRPGLGMSDSPPFPHNAGGRDPRLLTRAACPVYRDPAFDSEGGKKGGKKSKKGRDKQKAPKERMLASRKERERHGKGWAEVSPRACGLSDWCTVCVDARERPCLAGF